MWMSWSAKNASSIPSSFAFDRTQVSAACMDSCITCPSCPVMVNPPLPFMLLASTKSTSPPVGVHAKPTATPARLVAADGSNRPLQAAHTGFARVVANDEANRLLRKKNLVAGDSVLLDLPR